MPLFLSVGEAMIELSDAGSGLMRKGFAGDTFNTAYYARTCLPADWQVEYLTGFGRDEASAELKSFIETQNVGTRFCRLDAGRGPGLYMIHLRGGERSFSYWRDRSAARLLAADRDRLDAAFAEADAIYWSGITLAILEGDGRDNLLAAIGKARRAGKRTAFDPNLRPRLWPDLDMMREAVTAAARLADIVLPSLDDEKAHFGDKDAKATAARYQALGAGLVVVKDGGNGALVAEDGQYQHVPAAPVERLLDSTAAGDSFNAAFLAGLLTGRTTRQAAESGAQLAARVIAHPGAIVPREKLGL